MIQRDTVTDKVRAVVVNAGSATTAQAVSRMGSALPDSSAAVQDLAGSPHPAMIRTAAELTPALLRAGNSARRGAVPEAAPRAPAVVRI
ncbi:hypothetical protein N1027_01410 [Herbiconiux sp. CPCC 205763]|uniref:Uncharacterized protein n=1 Tax=Herbiconiux aconitum TaxID=2970913 RepID=A0ABT2GKP0_9MICO|nr:hypothetical protein [Herbiconiux aconitum]MCS5716788.1 hypothetical protein [Herbiconiux aconitum]